MVFLSICTALYDYVPQGEGELPIQEGEIIYILEKTGEDDWWKAKKKAPGEGEEEPVGLIPYNYVEEVRTRLRHQSAIMEYAPYGLRTGTLHLQEVLSVAGCWLPQKG